MRSNVAMLAGLFCALPNWILTLDVHPKGYWFKITGKTHPCGFSYISNQDGVIFHAEPIR